MNLPVRSRSRRRLCCQFLRSAPHNRPPFPALWRRSTNNLSFVLQITFYRQSSTTIRCADQRLDQTTFRALTAPLKRTASIHSAYSLLSPSCFRVNFHSSLSAAGGCPTTL